MNYDKTAVIIAARPVESWMAGLVPPDAFVLAADAGWRGAQQLGLFVDLAVGDFDSAPPPTGTGEVLRLPAEKDDTDTHYAAMEALRRGFGQVLLLGADGGRYDHQQAVRQTLIYMAGAGNGAHCAMVGPDYIAFGLKGVPSDPDQPPAWREGLCGASWAPGALWLPHGLRLGAAGEPAHWLSVFAEGGVATGVWERGMKYPLTDATLYPNVPLGTSNEFAAAQAYEVSRGAEIRCGEGQLLVVASL